MIVKIPELPHFNWHTLWYNIISPDPVSIGEISTEEVGADTELYDDRPKLNQEPGYCTGGVNIKSKRMIVVRTYITPLYVKDVKNPFCENADDACSHSSLIFKLIFVFFNFPESDESLWLFSRKNFWKILTSKSIIKRDTELFLYSHSISHVDDKVAP